MMKMKKMMKKDEKDENDYEDEYELGKELSSIGMHGIRMSMSQATDIEWTELHERTPPPPPMEEWNQRHHPHHIHFSENPKTMFLTVSDIPAEIKRKKKFQFEIGQK